MLKPTLLKVTEGLGKELQEASTIGAILGKHMKQIRVANAP